MGTWNKKELIFRSDRTLVYRVCDSETQKSFIIKSMSMEHPTQRELSRFFHEAEILSRIPSGGVIPALEKCFFDGHQSLLFPDHGGLSLAKLVLGPIELESFFKIACSLIQTLGEVHAKGVIHKDINPNNLLSLPDFSKTWMIDFGIASEAKREVQILKPVEDLEGTLHYLPPEQSGRVNRSLDYRADYYSLGITFFELLLGRKPFHSDDVMELLHAHLTQPLPDLSELRKDIPKSLAQVIQKLADKDPDNRYQSTSGLIADLKKAQDLWSQRDYQTLFSLGKDDFSERFLISEKIYGRERETQQLLEAFDEVLSAGGASNQNSGRVQATLNKFILVSGSSGAGKSALIHQLARPVALKNGYLLEGKIDQFHQGALLTGFKNGLLTAFDLLSGDSIKSLNEIKAELSEKLRSSVGVLTSLFPELATYFGEHSAPAAVGPRETRDRIFDVFRTLFQALCKQRPIIFFIDDLQWSDSLTLDLIGMLIQTKIQGFMFLGAYRSNDVGLDHPLTALIHRMEEQATLIELLPLGEQVMGQLVKDTLGNIKDLDTISQVIVQKTGGNPFFTHQLLKKLYAEEILVRDSETRAWQVKLDRLKELQVSQNVMEFLLTKFKALDPLTQDVLTAGAVHGAIFDLGIVAKVLGTPPKNLLAGVQKAVQEEIIRPCEGNYQHFLSSGFFDEEAQLKFQFLHDRLQHASYELKSKEERQQLHFRFGETLSELYNGRSSKLRLARTSAVEIADQYLKADLEKLPKRTDLRFKISKRIADAAVEAKSSSHFDQAYKYIQAAQQLFQEGDESFWSETPSEAWALYRESAIISFLAGDKKAATATAKTLLKWAQDPIKKAEVYKILSDQARLSGQVEEGLLLGMEGMACLGMKLKVHPPTSQVLWELFKALRLYKNFQKKHKGFEAILTLPRSSNEKMRAFEEIARAVGLAAYQTGKSNLVALICLIGGQQVLTEGLTPGSCSTLAGFLIVLNSIGNYRLSRALSEVSYKLLSHPVSTDKQVSTYAYFVWLICNSHFHYRKPLLVKDVLKVFELGVEHRDYAALTVSHDVIEFGAQFRPLVALAEYEETLTKADHLEAATQAQSYRLPASCTYRSFNAESPEEALKWRKKIEPLFERFDEEKDLTGRVHAKGNYGMISYFFRAYEDALASFETYYKNRLAADTLVLQYNYDILYALSLFSLRKNQGRGLSIRERVRVLQVRSFLKRLYRYNPENFGYYYLLFEAEYAAFKGGSHFRITDAYWRAIQSAEKDDNYLFQGLAHEKAGDYYQSIGNPQVAGFYYIKAHSVYKNWEGWALAKQLEERFPELFISLAKTRETTAGTQTSSTRTTTQNGTQGTLSLATSHTTTGIQSSTTLSSTKRLDLDEILKAARSLSGEIVLERLTEKLLKIVSEVSGAERGALLLPEEDEQGKKGGFVIAAQFNKSSNSPADLEIPAPLLNRVWAKKEAVIVADAQTDGRLKQEEAFLKKGIRSAVCLPSMNQGRLSAVLYLENNQFAGAFTRERMETLDILASQAAISVENAKLYETLEEKVIEKTRDIHAILKNLQQGIFTLQRNFTIHPEYSTYLEVILGTTELAGKNPLPLLLNHPSLGSFRQSEITSALETALGEPKVNFELNLHLLPTELTRSDAECHDQYLDLDWKPLMSVDGTVDRILVTLRDVTELKQLQAEAQEQKIELEMIGQILECGLDAFWQMIQHTKKTISASRVLIKQIEEQGTLSGESLSALFRNLHTMKGNSRTLGLSYAVDAAHEAERFLASLRKPGSSNSELSIRPTDDQLLRLETDLIKVESAIGRYSHLAETKLALAAAGVSETGLARPLQRIAETLKSQSILKLSPEEALHLLGDFHLSISYQPLSELLSLEIKSLQELARSLEKDTPKVQFQDLDESGNRYLFSIEHSQVLKDIFTHCFRNALDHGLETRTERTALGKSPIGKINLSLKRVKNSALLDLVLSDDGRGLNMGSLRKRGQSNLTDLEVAESILQPGVTTTEKVTELSGRGVGMDAVRALIENPGGKVRIEFTGEETSGGFRPFQLVLSIPADWVRSEKRTTLRAA